ncbi:MAG: DUF1893 domain-containing protein [Clostridiaceae bacterium]|nr:DUF1893 domain-containing protein [Clostridiaceae bacterium]
MDHLQEAVRKLSETDATFVAVNNDRIIESHERGIAPILTLLLTEPEALRGASVADKVIGKAAALLLIYAGVDHLHAKTISEHAVSVLSEHPVSYSFGQKVPFIVNRKGDGICPMEKQVLNITDPKKAFEILRVGMEL